ncbi:MAG TPA: bis(5'-nucleosyl)-tetraphosphatase (symmetrical) YqeK [Spirochaetales bacterium]|nr:bis(5'-nucleosyl)-tetraphosphatase (symmetrical) YqeK [Spirochaetales bacterium]HRY53331.1 bis(5'-nucleosyl)-tetraphosphatase (symmetrical) YqeK [Spirochaetia bacterium]HRZ66252.1 bis(5'-nucleosyl)-tetraphosphatase (symmetrical) YqeK [Spirochaetia bacterium]
MDYAELASRVEARISGGPAALSPRRLGHSRRVAELAARLCERAAIDPERGRAAGLAHDMCKELPKEEQAALAAAYPGAAASAFLRDKASHGPAAAFLLARDFGVDDAELLGAVAHHTLGRPGMSDLEVIVYCADKLEPGRGELEAGFRERCLGLAPGPLLAEVVPRSVRWLESEGLAVAPETRELLEYLEGKKIAS